MEGKTYIINPLRAIASAATAIVSIILLCTFLYLKALLPALVFLVIALVFATMAMKSGSKLSVDENGLVWKPLLGKEKKASWDEIKEVGVAGTRLFPKSEKGKAGQLYIYFSKTELTDQERFDMMLKWPPKDRFFLQYTDKRAEKNSAPLGQGPL